MTKFSETVLVLILAVIVGFAIVGLGTLFIQDLNQESPPVGTAIGTQTVYVHPTEVAHASGLSDETKELVEDLRWKHYPFVYVQPDTEWWAQQYPYLWFEDGVLYIEAQDTTWFVEMERKEK